MDNPTHVKTRRFIAYILDSLIVALISGGLWLALTDRVDADTTAGGGIKIGSTRYAFTHAHASHRTIWVVASVVIGLLIVVVIPGLRGRSPGKVLTGIRIVRSDGRPPGIMRSIVRYLMLVIDTLPGIPLVALVSMLASKTDRRLGDMVARTWVVKNSAAGRPASSYTGQAPAAAPPGPPS